MAEEQQADNQSWAEDPRARMLANLRTGNGRPELAALKHQGRRWMERSLAQACDQCIARATCDAYQAGGTCAIAEQYQCEMETTAAVSREQPAGADRQPRAAHETRAGADAGAPAPVRP